MLRYDGRPRRSWAKDLDARTLYELLKLRVEVSWSSRPAPTRSSTGVTCSPRPGTPAIPAVATCQVPVTGSLDDADIQRSTFWRFRD